MSLITVTISLICLERLPRDTIRPEDSFTTLAIALTSSMDLLTSLSPSRATLTASVANEAISEAFFAISTML